MNSRDPLQTTLFNSMSTTSQQKPSQAPRNRTPNRAGNNPDSDGNTYNFLLSNWTDYFGDDGNGDYNVINSSMPSLIFDLGTRFQTYADSTLIQLI